MARRAQHMKGIETEDVRLRMRGILAGRCGRACTTSCGASRSWIACRSASTTMTTCCATMPVRILVLSFTFSFSSLLCSVDGDDDLPRHIACAVVVLPDQKAVPHDL